MANISSSFSGLNTFIKFCGITRAKDALIASRLGVNAIGLVFYPPSKRAVSIDDAAVIVKDLNPLLMKVGLFVDADVDYVHEVIEKVGLNLLQFHGDESAQQCEYYERPYIKAVKVTEPADVLITADAHPNAQGLLLDTPSDKAKGGTGELFDWSLIPASVKLPIILAGGLNPGIVAQGIQAVRPHAVDVSSGIEIEPGIKSPEKMAEFVVQTKRALINQHQHNQAANIKH